MEENAFTGNPSRKSSQFITLAETRACLRNKTRYSSISNK